MSDVNLGTATGRIVIDAAGAVAGAATANAALNTISSTADQNYTGLRNLALGFSAVGIALDETIKTAVGGAIDWQAAQARIAATTYDNTASLHDNQQAMAGVSNGLRDLAAVTPVTISTINSVAEALAQQGLRGDAIVSSTRAIIDLNRLTGESYNSLVAPIAKIVGSYDLGAQGVTDFANALFEVSRGIPGQIDGILSLDQRITAAARSAGLGAQDTLALAAALNEMSASPRIAVTSLQQFLDALGKFHNQAGPEQTEFAKLAGLSAQQFAQAWGSNPIKVINDVAVGLGRLDTSSQQYRDELAILGVTQTRSQDALSNFARTQLEVAGTSESLAIIQQTVNDAWLHGNDIQTAVERTYNTTSAQLQITKNDLELAGNAIGSVLLPALNQLLRFVGDVAIGITKVSTPLRDIAGFGGSAAAALLTLGGAFLLIYPRITSAVEAINAMTVGRSAAAAAATREAEAAAEEVSTQEAVNQATIQSAAYLEDLVNVLNALFVVLVDLNPAFEDAAIGEGELATAAVATTGALQEEAVVADEAAVAVNAATFGISAVIGIAITAGIALLGLAGSHAKAKDEAKNQETAEQNLAQQLEAEGANVDDVTAKWIAQQLVMTGMIPLLSNVANGVKTAGLLVTGALSDQQQTQFLEQVRQQGNLTDAQFKAFVNTLSTMNKTLVGAASEATIFRHALSDLGDTQTTTNQAFDDGSIKLENEKQRLEAIASAASSLASTTLSAQSASISLANAQDTQAQAAEDLANKTQLIQTAQDKLADDADKIAKAQADLADAETKLATARSDAAAQLQKDEDSVVSAQLARERATLSLSDAEKTLDDLETSGAALQLEQATNALADANLKLLDTQQGVADAQWQLNYLIEEGASARDIANARNTLTAAQNAQKDAATGAQSAQQKLNDLQNGGIQEQLAKAQLDVRSAELAAQQAADQLATSTEKVNQDQQDIANDKAYKDALQAVQAAHVAVDDAINTEHADTDALHKLQDGSLERKLQQANVDLAKSAVDYATQLSNLQVQQDAVNGKVDSASEKDAILAHNLQLVRNQAGPMAGELGSLADQVQHAADETSALNRMTDPTAPSIQGIGAAAAGAHDPVANFAGATNDLNDALNRRPPNPGHWWDELGNAIGNFFSNIGNMLGSIANQIASAPGHAFDFLKSGWDKVFSGIPWAKGGLVLQPQIGLVGEAGPELVLPLTDAARMQEILSDTAVQNYMRSAFSGASASLLPATYVAGGGSAWTAQPSQPGRGGDTVFFNPITSADPTEIVNEYMWQSNTRRR